MAEAKMNDMLLSERAMMPLATQWLTAPQLHAMLGGGVDDSRHGLWLAPLNDAMAACGVTSRVRQTAFLTCALLQSAELYRLEDTLSYSPQRLCQVWPERFHSDTVAMSFSHAPERLANHVYAGLYGNGDEASGDGWRYHGRGLLRLNGRANYAALSRAFPIDALANPDLLCVPYGAALSAAWYWQANGLNELADLIGTAGTGIDAQLEELARRVNGASSSPIKRRVYWARVQLALERPSGVVA
jgi:putative chitinase